MRLHHTAIGRKKITVDGVEMIVSIDNPEPVIQVLPGTDLSIVTVGILCEKVVLDGDSHDTPETTPIYDQLMKEKEDAA